LSTRTSRLIALGAALLCALPLAAGEADPIFYVGTYTGGPSKGIYAYRFHPATAQIQPLGLMAATENPTFLTLDPHHKFLYAVNETSPRGHVSAYAIDPLTGALTFLDKVSSHGAGPCYLTVDPTDTWVIVANYASGSVAELPIKPDGSLGAATAFRQHAGSSVNPARQKGPHAHGAFISPDGHLVFATDLGLDKIMIYEVDGLKPHDPPFTKIKPGSGPRHLAFTPNGHFAYLISEMGSTVTAFSFDASHGTLTQLQTVSTLPADFHGKNTAAEIAVHPNGKFVYASNRGDNSIAVFKIDPATGTLTLVERVSTEGKTPRNFVIDSTGRYLFDENQDSNNIVLFHLDEKTGRLTPTGKKLELGSPVCIVFL
jgi:6-phosphogluconolactonase